VQSLLDHHQPGGHHALFRVVNRYVGNLAPMPGVFPDYKAPIVRNGAGGRELATARWGMPSSSKALMDATKKRAEKLRAKGKSVDFTELLRMEPDGGTTNIRNVKSKHWTRWLGPENRCVVPFNSFSEFNKAEGGGIWFALDETRPLACFAGIWTNWTSVRKVKEGETTNDLFAFLTTEPNAEVGTDHPQAMPVILTTPDEVEAWMTAPPDEALKLQRPLPDGALQIVARGVKEDTAVPPLLSNERL
jgi:putative SOS response-associated peptidase YedK